MIDARTFRDEWMEGGIKERREGKREALMMMMMIMTGRRRGREGDELDRDGLRFYVMDRRGPKKIPFFRESLPSYQHRLTVNQ